jgi:hypothetical protein
MISVVRTPWAVRRTIEARHTCFCGALRSAVIAASRAPPSAVTEIEIQERMLPDSHIPRAKGIQRVEPLASLSCERPA